MRAPGRFDSGLDFGDPRVFLVGLEVTAGLLFAQHIAGKAVRDGLFLLRYGPQALPWIVAAAAAFSIVLSLLNGRLMRRLSPRSVLPWMLYLSGIGQIAEWWLLRVDPGLAVLLIYL